MLQTTPSGSFSLPSIRPLPSRVASKEWQTNKVPSYYSISSTHENVFPCVPALLAIASGPNPWIPLLLFSDCANHVQNPHQSQGPEDIMQHVLIGRQRRLIPGAVAARAWKHYQACAYKFGYRLWLIQHHPSPCI